MAKIKLIKQLNPSVICYSICRGYDIPTPPMLVQFIDANGCMRFERVPT